MPQAKRLVYLDNLKALLIALVVLHHAGQAYGPTGGYWDISDVSRWNILGPFFAVNASFFMALFFFISAYFFAPSYDKKGAGAFVRDKLVRLGIPVLLGLLVLVPLYQYFSFGNFRGGQPISYGRYFIDVFLGMGDKPDLLRAPNWPELNYGPFWFILHLLVYSLLYALIRKIASLFAKKKAADAQSRTKTASIPLFAGVLLFAALVAVATALIRTKYPIDKWIGFLGFIQAEPGHFVIYFGMILAGIGARRFGWLERIKKAEGYAFLAAGVAMALAVFISRAQTGEYPPWLMDVYGVYEPVMGVFLCVGLLTLGRETLCGQGKVWAFLSGNAFGVYILHVPVLILCQAAILSWPLHGAIKFLLSAAVAYALCNAVVAALRKFKLVRRVIG